MKTSRIDRKKMEDIIECIMTLRADIANWKIKGKMNNDGKSP
jgi:hypothetical protein